MAASNHVAKGIQHTALKRVIDHLERNDDTMVFTLVELHLATAMDPDTVEVVMQKLSDTPAVLPDDFSITEVDTEYGERQWRVRRH